jgi:hypothetical protein
MAKIRLISWRRREKKFPETEAQRQARARERSIDNDQCHGRMAGLEVLGGAPPGEFFEFDDEHLMDELSALTLLTPNNFPDAAEENIVVSTETCISADFTADQSCALRTLPFLSTVSEDTTYPAVFHLQKSQDYRGTTLQFSLQTQVLPEMLSLKELCRQLKVSRHTVIQLIRQ